MTKIVLITSGQPTTNPRLVKEADALVANGFEVIVIYQFLNEWATVQDEQLIQSKKWKAIRVGGYPKNGYLDYLRSRVEYRLGRFLIKYLGVKSGFAEMALSRNTRALIKKAKSISASLYIAHNLGALPAAVLASKKNQSKCGFDAEDFHRQEVTDNQQSQLYKLTKFIEDKYIPKVNYLTAASPLIGKAYQKLYPTIKPIIINNVFPLSFLQKIPPTNQNELKLFWFSQTIGKGRGIEDAIQAIALLKKKAITLGLLGNINDENRDYFIGLSKKAGLTKNQLIFISPVNPESIYKLAANYDIGLAIEQDYPLNRTICLTNKIFTYLTSALAVIVSETMAQKDFIIENPLVGKSYPIGDISVLSKIIDAFDKNRKHLYTTKVAAQQLAKQKLNWEIEQQKFISLIRNLN